MSKQSLTLIMYVLLAHPFTYSFLGAKKQEKITKKDLAFKGTKLLLKTVGGIVVAYKLIKEFNKWSDKEDYGLTALALYPTISSTYQEGKELKQMIDRFRKQD